jgi:hypothetical protein
VAPASLAYPQNHLAASSSAVRFELFGSTLDALAAENKNAPVGDTYCGAYVVNQRWAWAARSYLPL